jgi:YndJ-like protein
VPTFWFGRGPGAAAWVIPWLGVAVLVGIKDVSAPLPVAAASLFLMVSAASLVASRLGITVGRIGEPIVELTAVHYGVAGYGATLLAWRSNAVVSRRHRRVATIAIVATIAAPPLVALGFLTGAAVPQVGGAALLTVGVLATAFVTGTDARRRAGDRRTKALFAVCAAAPVAPMVLAVVWAAAQHWAVPALDIPSMARIHGTTNFVGFVACGLVGYQRLRVITPLEAASC